MSELERKHIVDAIAALEAKKETCKGSECEVYTRVVGFIRPVKQFNKGKKEEFAMRKMFTLKPCGCNK